MYNPYIAVPFLVWAITQFTKFVIAALRGNVDYRYLYASGGMPSVHSAVVVSLATTALLIDGPKSSEFGITAVLAGIVMYDSFGVRRASGDQAKAINVVLDSMNQSKIRLAHPQDRLREVLGHKPLEVTVGAIIGFLLAALLNAQRLNPLFDIFTHPIGRPVILVMAVVAGLLIIGGFVLRLWLAGKYKDIHRLRRVIIRTSWISIGLGVVGAFLAFMAYQKIPVALWVLWPILFLLLVAVVVVTKLIIYKDEIPGWIEHQKEDKERQRWLEGPNKKKRAAKARSRKKR